MRSLRRQVRWPSAVILSMVLLAGSLIAIGGSAAAQGETPQASTVGTAFTYQGRLLDNSVPATGTYDLQFVLYTASAGGSQVGPTLTKDDVAVSDGYFTVLLDFGNVFNGSAAYLEVGVRPGASTGGYTALSPRVDLTAAPHALFSLNAQSAPWSGLTGVPAGFADGVDNDTTYANGFGLSLSGSQFAVVTSTIQARVTGTCSVGNAIRAISANGTVTCEPISGAGSALTGVGAGAGLIGGGNSGVVTLTVNFAGSGSSDTVARSDHDHDFQYWRLNGNTGAGGGNFLGTLDNTTLNLGVNGQPALRIYPHSQGPNIVGGYGGNYISPTLYGQTIAGGGSFFYENRTLREYGTVGGGRRNQSDGYGSTIAGGIDNRATNDYGVVAGGLNNQATGSAAGIGAGFYNVAAGYVSYVGGGDLNLAMTQNATIGGGYSNTVTGGQLIANNTIGGGVFNYNSGFAATIAGGHGNQATGEWSSMGGGGFNVGSNRSSTVSGGEYNNVSGARGTIGGGAYNVAAGAGSTIGGGGYNGSNTFSGNRTYGTASTIGGGYGNVTSGDAGYGVIGGGWQNQITATAGTNLGIGTIGGGYNNRVTLGGATIGGGNSNTASGFDATVGGGNSNTASGGGSIVPGGISNLAQGNTSFAAGYRAKAYNNGCFAWNDSTDADLVCNTNNTFVVRSTGGVIFGTNAALSTGCSIPAGGGGWACSSDRNVKTNFAQLDGRQVLEQLSTIPIQSWTFKTENPTVRHIGPTAQDFYTAFGLGEDNKHINSIDADGVSLAAIQGLYQIAQEKDAQVAQLQARLDALENHANPIGAAAPDGLIWFVAGAAIGISSFWLGTRRAKGKAQ